MSKVTKAVEVTEVTEVTEIQSFTVREITITRSEIENMDKDAFGDFAFGKKLKLKEIEKAWAVLGAKSTKSGVYENILSWLGKEPRTESDLAEFMLNSGESSINEIRWFNARNALRQTIVSVFIKYIPEGDFVEVPATKEVRENLVKIVKDHDEAKKAAKAKAAK